MTTLATIDPGSINDTFASVTLAVGENDVFFKSAAKIPVVMQLKCDAAWFYRSAAGGNNFPIAANETFNIRITDPVGGFRAYVLTQGAASANLYFMRVG